MSNNLVVREKKPFFPPLLVSALCIGMCVAAYVHRAELTLIVSHFSLLWSVAQNRPEIVRIIFAIPLTGGVFVALSQAAYLVVVYVFPDTIDASNVTNKESHLSGQYPADPVLQRQSGERDAMHVSLPATPATPLPPVRSAFPETPLTPEQPLYTSPLFSSPLSASLPTTPLPGMVPLREGSIHVEGKTQGDEHSDAHSYVVPVDNEEDEDEEDEREEEEPSLGTGDEVVIPETRVERIVSASANPVITITLIKTMEVFLHVPGSPKAYPITGLTAKALQLIAYIAWREGQAVNLGDMREDIFGNDEMQIQEIRGLLNNAKREIRRRIADAVERAKGELGQDLVERVLPPNLDIFGREKKRYWLADHCRVTDVHVIQGQHRIIQQAVDKLQLVNTVPDEVYAACITLIEAYKGDFLEDLLIKDPYAFDSPSQSWAREPFTLFRDYYLQALLYAAEYHRVQGDRAETEEAKRKEYEAAARLFVKGAMAACNPSVFGGRFDTKVSFYQKSRRRYGAHVLLGEQFMRRALALYGRTGNTIKAKGEYAEYEGQMNVVSNGAWSADPETVRDLEAAVQQTGGYRFAQTTAIDSPATSSASALQEVESSMPESA